MCCVVMQLLATPARKLWLGCRCVLMFLRVPSSLYEHLGTESFSFVVAPPHPSFKFGRQPLQSPAVGPHPVVNSIRPNWTDGLIRRCVLALGDFCVGEPSPTHPPTLDCLTAECPIKPHWINVSLILHSVGLMSLICTNYPGAV